MLPFGEQFGLARNQRRISIHDLAEGVGIARFALQRIEKGDPAVESGLVFGAATLTGVGLFVSEATTLAPRVG